MRRGSTSGADRAHNRVVSTGSVQGATEIVGLLGRPMVGMTEEGLGNTDIRGIADRQLRRNDLSKEVRVEGAAKLAFRDRADKVADTFCCKRPAAIAHPKRVTRHPRPRPTHQLPPLVRDTL